MCCVMGYLSTLHANVVDANLRNAKATIEVGVLGILLFITLTTLHCIVDQRPFDLVINGRIQSDAGDVLTFTTSTFAAFLIKLGLIKRPGAVPQCIPGSVTVLCATVRSGLRLVLKARIPSDSSPSNTLASSLQRLRLREQKAIEIDGLNTVHPHRHWRKFVLQRRCLLHALLRLAGTTGYPLMCVQCCINYRRMLAVSVGESIELATQPSLIAVASLVCTSVHCGTFVLFYQRDLLRDLVPLFDFLFTSIQFLIFSLCMCDAALWRADMVLVLFSFNLWLLWMLTLDALTPNMKRLLGFSKRHIIHVSATVLLSCVGILGLIFFTQTNPLRDRVLWSHQVSPTHTITLRVQAILIGRIITILRWCSRQTVLLLLREEDELQSIHGVVLYDNPYESFPAPRKRIKTLMQDHKTPGEGPNL